MAETRALHAYGAELQVAEEAAREAGALVVTYVGTDQMAARLKGDRDVVTAADEASERLIVDRLSGAFSDDGIVAEEGSGHATASGRRWYVDPLDGTMNYSRGVPIWCVSISLFDGPDPVVGVVFDPLRNELFAAARGSGAYLNGARIATSGIEDMGRAVLHLTVDIEAATMPVALECLQTLAPQLLRTRNIGSASLALAYVGAGRYDAMVHFQAHPWDYGAAALIVQEAGGHITGLSGSPYTVGDTAVLAAASSKLHKGLLHALPGKGTMGE